MRCSSCERENPESASFCGDCGSRLSREVVCSSCGRSNPEDVRFCHGCGNRIGLSPTSAPQIPPAPSSDLPTSFDGGRNRIEKLLVDGGKKRVYLAHDESLERDVALAVIKTEGLDETSRARMLAGIEDEDMRPPSC